MTKSDMEDFRDRLAESYNCSRNEVKYEFEKILDEHDEDRDDCIWIKYKWLPQNGRHAWREIYSVKLPIPPEIKTKAEQMMRERERAARAARRAKNTNLITSAEGSKGSTGL